MKAVFLDRDGTIIEDADYARDPAVVKLLPGAADALADLQAAGYLLFVVSNQSGVGRGIIRDSEFAAVHERFDSLLRDEGIRIEEYGYCLHTPEQNCRCRKPNTELVERMCRSREIELEKSFVIGDKPCDIELGKKLGTQTILVLTGKGAASQVELLDNGPKPDLVFASLSGVGAALTADIKGS